MEIITENEAYSLYLHEHYDDVMPFKSIVERDFIDELFDRGIWVAKHDEDVI